ncbi:MAG: cytochrome P450 [Acidimicrobiia bacterium]
MKLEFGALTGEDSVRSVLTTEFDTSIYGIDAQEVWASMIAQGPVLWPNPGCAVTASAAAVHESLHDASIFSSNPAAGYFGSDTGAIPLQIDPPMHSRYRKMLDPLFTPKLMAAREGQAAEIVNRLIDKFIDRGNVDFSHEFAVPFPSEMFLTLMGLPLDELTDFLRIKEEMIRPQGADEAARIRVQEKASMWIADYINTALSQREKNLTDDILSYFLGLEREGRLSREEIINICILFIPAGLDTVTDTLECSLAFLSTHPAYRQQIVDDPNIVGRAVEELLRYETPVPTVSRIAMSDTTLAGCPVAKGTRVRSVLAVANHDPSVFVNPQEVDFNRESNPHIAFGGGVHRCVGSHLARLELRVALREWHRRIPEYSLAEGTELRYRRGLREIEHLPLVFPAAGAR